MAAEKEYEQLSARIGADEVFLALVTGFCVGMVSYVVISTTIVANRWCNPYWSCDSKVALLSLFAMALWVGGELEYKIRKRQQPPKPFLKGFVLTVLGFGTVIGLLWSNP